MFRSQVLDVQAGSTGTGIIIRGSQKRFGYFGAILTIEKKVNFCIYIDIPSDISSSGKHGIKIFKVMERLYVYQQKVAPY